MQSMTKVSTAVLILTVGVFFSACRKGGTPGNGNKVQPVDVRIEILKPSRLLDGVEIAGAAKAYEEVNLSPEEGGVVKEWKAQKGQQVKKGDLVVVLKDEVIRAGYDAAQAQYKMAELNFQKQEKVFDQQAISELQYKNLQYARDAARANAELMKARWERTQLRSPINGVVDNTYPNEGEFAPPGVPIAHLVNIASIKVQAEVPELYADAIHLGTPAVVTFDAVPGDTLSGKVSFLSSSLSTANRSLVVEIILSNPLRKVKPEMVAKVSLLRETKTNALMVSESIVQLVDRDRTIIYVENGGKAEERRLRLGGRQGNKVEVLEGLNPGDHVIIAGYQKLVDGTPVVVAQ